MYKEIIICMVIIVTILVLNCFLQDYTKNSVAYMTNDMEELKQNLKEEDKEKIEAKMSAIKDKWGKIYSNLAAYIEHDELEKVKTDLVALEGFIEVEDYDTGINELNKSVYVLEHIADKYDFSFVNVF